MQTFSGRLLGRPKGQGTNKILSALLPFIITYSLGIDSLNWLNYPSPFHNPLHNCGWWNKTSPVLIWFYSKFKWTVKYFCWISIEKLLILNDKIKISCSRVGWEGSKRLKNTYCNVICGRPFEGFYFLLDERWAT